MRCFFRGRVPVAVFASILCAAPLPADAGYTVNILTDTVAIDSDCSLREAISAATGGLSDCLNGPTTSDVVLGITGDYVLSTEIAASLPASFSLSGAGSSVIRIHAASNARAFAFTPVGASSSVVLSGVTIEADAGPPTSVVAGNGGLLLLQGNTSLSTSDVVFDGGRALAGGCVAVEGTSLSLNNTSFSDCHASSGNGGAVLATGLDGLSSIAVSGVAFSGCSSAANGGALALQKGTAATVAPTGQIGAAFTSNQAVGQGGGFFTTGLGALTLTSANLSQNSALEGGAGYVDATPFQTQSGLTVLDNQATEKGGGFYVAPNVSATIVGTFSRNIATTSGLGGALFLDTGSTTNVVSGAALGPNNSAQSGGAIYCQGTSLTISSATFTNNGTFPAVASTLFATLGGALSIQDPCALQVTNSSFTSNRSTGSGGALYIDAPSSSLSFASSLFVSNQATTAGGAVALANAGGSSRFVRTVFSGNNAGRGGALDLSAPLAIERSYFVNNQATVTHGGAIHNGITASDGLVVLHSTFTQNQATSEGGAIYNSGLARLNNLSIISNVAARGGGVSDHSPRTALEYNFLANSIVSRNTATLPPLAHDLFVTNNAALDVRASVISRADNSGLTSLPAHNVQSGSIAQPLADGLQTNPAQNNDGNTDQRTFALFASAPHNKLGGSVVGFPCGSAHGHEQAHATDVWPNAPSNVDQRNIPRPAGPTGTAVTAVAPTTGPLFRCDAGAYEAPRAALSHSIGFNASPLVPGQSTTITATLSNALSPSDWLNLPPADAGNGATLTAQTPSTVSGSWSCLYTGGAAGPAVPSNASSATLSVTPTALPPGGSVSCSRNGTIPPDQRGQLQATANHSLANNSLVLDATVPVAASATAPLSPVHDLAVTVPDLNLSAARFSLVTITPTWRNDGPSSALEAFLSVSAPFPELQFVPEASSSDCTSVGGNVSCAAVALSPTTSTQRTLAFRLTGTSGPVENVVIALQNLEATVSPGNAPLDPEPPTPSADPSSVTVVVSVTAPSDADLALTINPSEPIAPASTLLAGEALRYSTVLRNFGPGIAAEFTLSTTLGTNQTTFVAVSQPAECSTAPSTVGSNGPFTTTCTCSGACVLESNAAWTIALDTVIAEDATGDTVTNGPPAQANSGSVGSASVAKPNDPVPTNDLVEQVRVPFQTSADQSVQLTLSLTDPVNTKSSAVVLRCSLQNAGPSAARDSRLTIEIPSGTTLLDLVAPSSFQCARPATGSAGTVLCDANPHRRTTEPEDFVVTLTPDAEVTRVDATCSVASITSDPNLLNNQASAGIDRPIPPVDERGIPAQLRGGLSGQGCRCSAADSATEPGEIALFAVLAVAWLRRRR